MSNTSRDILKIEGLKTWFPVRGGWLGRKRYVRAVDGVDLSIPGGKTLGLVGESGSGKTTVGRTILRLIPATAGRIFFEGTDVLELSSAEMRILRRDMQIIFQDPVGSLNPRMTVGDIVAEPLKVHFATTRSERRMRVGRLLERVGLSAAYVNRYPHEFSGGQRQRIGIARALAAEPQFIVCDEPVSALDVSIQAQILNLLSDLQDELGLTYLFIAHNLAVVEHFADEVAVMYLGRIVERAGRDELYRAPKHPYTEALLSAVPMPEPGRRADRVQLPGETPSPIAPPTGCRFHPRCPLTRRLAAQADRSETTEILTDAQPVRIMAKCMQAEPELLPVGDGENHCHACLMRQ